MARVVAGYCMGTIDDLTFYKMEGRLYVRMKSSLTAKRVKRDKRFARTLQSAEELGRAAKIASRVYRTLSKEQKQTVYVLYKKMTGVVKLALRDGKEEEECLRLLHAYLVKEGVMQERKERVKKTRQKIALPALFQLPFDYFERRRKCLAKCLYKNTRKYKANPKSPPTHTQKQMKVRF